MSISCHVKISNTYHEYNFKMPNRISVENIEDILGPEFNGLILINNEIATKLKYYRPSKIEIYESITSNRNNIIRILNLVKLLNKKKQEYLFMVRNVNYRDKLKCIFCGDKYIIKVDNILLSKGEKREEIFRNICLSCYMEDIEKRIVNTVKWHNMVNKKQKYLLCVSGGKDSLLLLDVFIKNGISTNCDYIFIDNEIELEGNSSKEVIEFIERKYKIHVNVLKLSQYYKGNLHLLMNKKENKIKYVNKCGICSLCVSLRNELVNKYALEKNIRNIVYGDNKNDFKRHCIQNSIMGKMEKKFFPVKNVSDNKYSIYPLFEITDKEALLWSRYNKLITVGECPYKSKSRELIDSFVNKFDILNPQIISSLLYR